jgi:hypothetical protein
VLGAPLGVRVLRLQRRNLRDYHVCMLFLEAKKHVCMISTMKLVNHGKTIFTGAEPN